MYEIDISNVVTGMRDPFEYSASIAERGPDAGRMTWAAACQDALELFGETFDRESFDAFFSGFGAWTDEELAAHTDDECAALMLQFIAGGMRECESIDAEPFTDEWWDEYRTLAETGTVVGRFSKHADGSGVLYYIGE